MPEMPAGLDPDRIPTHVAIIMDGNGRWANARGLERTAGHAAAEHTLFDLVNGALELGIGWLTVYAFSTENWNRSPEEVEFLMEFNDSLLRRRRDEVHELGIRVRFAGVKDDPRVPKRVQLRMAETEAMTAANSDMHLVFAFNYGGRRELADAARKLAAEAAAGVLDPALVDEAALAERLYIPEMPDPDVIIRTSGEQRISNFLLWQAAYAELVFVDTLFPDFDRRELAKALVEFQRRRRRFGIT